MAAFSENDINVAMDCAARSYGYNELKKEQRAIIFSFVSGHDVFGCLPTGEYMFYVTTNDF